MILVYSIQPVIMCFLMLVRITEEIIEEERGHCGALKMMQRGKKVAGREVLFTKVF